MCVKGLTVDLQNIHPERHTIVNYEGTDKSYTIDDVWANRSTARQALGDSWAGEAHFMVTPEGTADAPVPDRSEAQGQEDTRPIDTGKKTQIVLHPHFEQKREEDYLERQEETWVRHHVQARAHLFGPTDVKQEEGAMCAEI